MKVRDFGEEALIAAFAEIYRVRSGVELGIGDDGAIVRNQTPRTVISTDIASEGVHFNRLWSTPTDIGAKIAIANLADIFAMGGTPRFLTVAISASGDEEVSYLLDIARGIESVAALHDVSIIGGDVVAGSALTISITAFGEIEKPKLRSGAQVGDVLFLTRGTGRSLGGLLLLSKGLADSAAPEVKVFQRPDFHPEDLQNFGLENISALMDVSDGLISDLNKIATASSVSIDLQFDSAQLQYLQTYAMKTGVPELELFLRSGEEHSFIVVIPEEFVAKVPVTWIKLGHVMAGAGLTHHGGQLEITKDSWHW